MTEHLSSVWLTGQQQSAAQRRGRYLPESMAHPGKMLPAIAARAISTYTEPGELVCDPMCGIGTSLVEAAHLGRYGVGVEFEQRWAELAAANLALAGTQGASGSGQVWCADARDLPAPLPESCRGEVSLVLTSPPYGPSTHGHARSPGPRRGKVRKVNNRYATTPGQRSNLADRSPDELAEGFTRILTGARALLRPGGHAVITARPYRHGGELVDLPGMVITAGQAAGLELVDRCVALIAGIRGGRLVPRGSFFQQHNIRLAHAAGDPQWLIGHEDVLAFRLSGGA
ncbi:TRM11 family SAM-dependent methyltransferase [Cryptosporangium sp. NPDC048952]|uniref:TRM11 family SAM-dependent methyltransferase n=1 Tax=Cryptosporangium sp. NPDC048952 TaxID=3363961 RepID=UPI003714454F